METEPGILTNLPIRPMEGLVMPVSPEELLAEPRGAHSLVLALVAQLAADLGEPVLHETLQWYADAVEPGDDHGSVATLREVLGPPPRRTALILVLSDLVDLGLLEQDFHGFYVIQAGHRVVKRLSHKNAPRFPALVVS